MNASKHTKTSVHITPASRVEEFGSQTFVVEGGLLVCKVCNVNVDHVCRQTVSDHLQSKRHSERDLKRKAEITAGVTQIRQKTIIGCNSRQTAASIAKENLTISLVEAFMAANIPMEKLDHSMLNSF